MLQEIYRETSLKPKNFCGHQLFVIPIKSGFPCFWPTACFGITDMTIQFLLWNSRPSAPSNNQVFISWICLNSLTIETPPNSSLFFKHVNLFPCSYPTTVMKINNTLSCMIPHVRNRPPTEIRLLSPLTH